MKSKRAILSACLLAMVAPAAEPDASAFRKAFPGYAFSFPKDHFDHPEFRTEWWYYTGNVRDSNGRRFGFELTFFRHAVQPGLPENANVWDIRDAWMAHFALSDIEGGAFLNRERYNRSGAGLAGVDASKGRIWNGNWMVQWSNEKQHLRAIADEFAIDLTLRQRKPPVVHGLNGVSQKSAVAGRASHYVSLTRLATDGVITLEGKQYRVDGEAWMDHEFFSNSMESDQSGWDWFSLQLADGSELMLYRLRRKDGSVEPFSSGTYVDATGKSRHLPLREFELIPGKTWRSAKTSGTYPIAWEIRVPSLQLQLEITTKLPQQELTGRNSYWEGAIDVSGTRAGKPVRGSGYLEMTGYAGSLRMGE